MQSVYVPTTEDIEAFTKAQNAHGQTILELIGAEESERLGYAAFSATREHRRWQGTFPEGTIPYLESGLASKKEGLEAMRRTHVPNVRMYDVAEYYYKVGHPALGKTL